MVELFGLFGSGLFVPFLMGSLFGFLLSFTKNTTPIAITATTIITPATIEIISTKSLPPDSDVLSLTFRSWKGGSMK